MLSNRRVHVASNKHDRFSLMSRRIFLGCTNIFKSTILFLCSSKSNGATARKASDILVKQQAGNCTAFGGIDENKDANVREINEMHSRKNRFS